jgi:hypothetical protein
MDLESFILTVFCTIDDFFHQSCPKLRRRGPAPTLADSEVLTIETVGEFLRIDTDRELYSYFRHHFGDFFPGLRTVHRTTFARQAANLWVIKFQLWQHLAATAHQDPALALIDSLPVPVCHFARAHRCRGFPGIASFGHDALAHQTSYGLRLHLRVTWPGVITAATLAPAHAADLAVAPELLASQTGWVLGDGAYWSPRVRTELADQGLARLAPPRGTKAMVGKWPRWLVQTRRRIETVLSQLAERYHAKRIWARDVWHLTSRWLRKLVSHTMAVLLCQRSGLTPLAFAKLITP